ncbi:hypothetical protein FHX35_002168 [Auritidibacter ignavus]|nr:hypothetical protein [Auritidibacter ignavus]
MSMSDEVGTGIGHAGPSTPIARLRETRWSLMARW